MSQRDEEREDIFIALSYFGIDSSQQEYVYKFIMKDRKRMLDEIEKPLIEYRNKFTDTYWNEDKENNIDPIASIDSALLRIQRLKNDIK